MMLIDCRSQFTADCAPRETGWCARFVRALALIGLLLLPIEIRAGTERPHPHALFQVLLDASDGKIDHHADDASTRTHHLDGEEHEALPNASESRQPDVPIYSDVIAVSASLGAAAPRESGHREVGGRIASRRWNLRHRASPPFESLSNRI
jgi:hypothetical protein